MRPLPSTSRYPFLNVEAFVIGVVASCLCMSLAPDVHSLLGLHIALQFEKAGRRVPKSEQALDRAAEILAIQALSRPLSSVTEITSQLDAFSKAGIGDPAPRIIILKDVSLTQCLAQMRLRKDLSDSPATHIGLGFAEDAAKATLVVILSERKASLSSFRGQLPAPPHAAETFCIQIPKRFVNPEVFVTNPSGKIDTFYLEVSADEDQACLRLSFAAEGRHIVEIVAAGPAGPEVLALWLVSIGDTGAQLPSEENDKALPLALIRRVILNDINSLRARRGLPSMQRNPRLDEISQNYAETLAQQQFLAHTTPEGDSFDKRLKGSRFEFKTAGENLGLSASPWKAHKALAQSPSHLKNLVNAKFTLVGLGIAQRISKQGKDFVVVETFAEIQK